jgi:itaconyl-CoA hydratase
MFFEEFKIGKQVTTASREVTVDDLDSFIRLTGLNNPLFMDDRKAVETGYASRLAPGPYLLSLAMGLVQQSGIFDHVIALLQFDELRFIRTVHPGDTLVVDVTPLHRNATSKAERGLVEIAYELKNQNNQTVLSTRATYLIWRRPEDTND